MKYLEINKIVRSISITHKFNKEQLHFLNTSDILAGKIINDNILPIDELKGQAKKTIMNNDILFSEIRPKNKRYALVNVDNPEDYVVSTKLMVLRKFNEDVDLKYFYYYLTSDYLLDILQKRAENRIGSFPQITFDLLSEYKVPIPSLKIQKKIAGILESIENSIRNKEEIIKENERIVDTIFSFWFLQYEFPDKNGHPYKSSGGAMVWNEVLNREIPKDWKVEELGEHLTSSRGISYNSGNLEGDGIPMINLASFGTNGTYKDEGIKNYSGEYPQEKTLKPYDLVMCNTQQTAIDFDKDIIGKAFLVPDIFEGDIVHSHHVTKITVKNEDYKYYLCRLFDTKFFHKYIAGFTNGTNILGLDFSGVETYKTEIPDSGLVKKFAELSLDIEKKKSEIIKENKELASLRDFLLPLLMNGQVTFKD